MRISVVGLGYIGLPTALLLASNGHTVYGCDIDAQKIQSLNEGKVPFVEDGMVELLVQARSTFTADTVVHEAEAYIIAVPTPVTAQHTCDAVYVAAAARSVAGVIKKGDLVILESTVSPGTTEGIVKTALETSGLKAGEDFLLGYVSEKAIPGNTLREMKENDRIIGGINIESQDLISEIYKSFVNGAIFRTTCIVAETVKLVENAYRDVNIAFANELAQICGGLGMNVWEVISLANKHPRVNVHQPGPGVGGHCIAVDPWFLIEGVKNDHTMIRHAREINESAPMHVLAATEKLAQKFKSKTIGVLGVAYKKNVDDSRESPAITIIDLLISKGYEVVVHDPFVVKFAYPIVGIEEFFTTADAVILVTDHDLFKTMQIPESVAWTIDTRAALDPKKINGEYILLGTPEYQGNE